MMLGRDRFHREPPRSKYVEVTEIPKWKRVFAWVGLILGIAGFILWIPALVSWTRWRNGQTEEPAWAWVYGFLLTASLTIGVIYELGFD